jgi:hypothetical protein
MFFLTYSQEILFLVLSVCSIAITVFLVWFLYYLIQASKEIRQASTLILEQTRIIEKWIKQIKRNLSVGIAVAGVVKEVAHSAKDFFDNWRNSSDKKDDEESEIFTNIRQ